MTFISGGPSRFLYFDVQLGHPPWPSLRVLDFGGNGGNLLCDSRCTIDYRNYWSMDVSRDAIALGQRRFPDAHFVFYDRFHPFFNPDGEDELTISLPETFDVVLAYSVLTHLSIEETGKLWKELRALLRPGGEFAFTFMDPRYRPAPRLPDNLENRLRGRKAPSPSDFDVVAVIDGQLADAHRYPAHATQYDVLHSCELVQRLFPDAVIKPPVFGERQHCAIVRA
jgi:SAM-dependent methyltransferase